MPQIECPQCGKLADCFAKQTGQTTLRFTLRCEYCGHKETEPVYLHRATDDASAKLCPFCQMRFCDHVSPPVEAMATQSPS